MVLEVIGIILMLKVPAKEPSGEPEEAVMGF
jgi:hypothetical protein